MLFAPSAAGLKLVVDLPPQPHALVRRGERERLPISIKARICNQIQLLQEPECPEGGDVRADFSTGRAFFDRHNRRTSTPNLVGEVLLAKPAADAGQADSRAQAKQRLSLSIVQ